MRNHSLFGLFTALFLMGGSVFALAANPDYFYSLPDGTVLLERPCWVHPDSIVRNTFAKEADFEYYYSTCPERKQQTVKYKMSVNFEDYLQQTALWMQDSIIGFGPDKYSCHPTGFNISNCRSTIQSNYPNFYALYDKIKALKSYHPNLYREYFYRTRPLHYFNGTDSVVRYPYGTDTHESYPSGHGYVDWLAAMSMLYLDADSTVKIVQMGHELNWFRVLFNKHWLSDLDAGNKLASAAFPVLLRSDEYQGLLNATITEFADKRTFPTYADARSHMAKLPDCKKVSNAPFTTSSYEWKADTLEYTRALDLRETERGAQALLDADYTTWLARFSAKDVMNVDLANKQLFPNLQEMFSICREMAEYAADASRCHMRVNPNTYFAKGQTMTSAVSADAYMAWMVGLALTYVDTAHATVIERTALDIAEGGYILGNYWQSEIENSEKMGSIGFAMAMRNPHFRALADAAIQELAYAKTVVVVPEDKDGTQTLEQAQAAVNNVLDACMNKTKDIMISRTFYCDGYYNTLCLPFSISATDWADADKNPLVGGTLKKFADVTVVDDVLYIQLEEADSIKAGVPYLIKFAAGDNIVNPVFKSMKVTTKEAGASESESMNCQGVMAPCAIDAQQAAKCLIMGGQNTLYWADVTDGEYLRGFRAYFKVNDAPTAPIRRGMAAQFADKKVPTSISPIHQFTDSPIYKLIDNGEVIIIRDGKKYNVQGIVR